MTTITVKDITRGEILAQGVQGEDAILLEGCYYFDPEAVRVKHLRVTDRTYVCLYKGKSYWIDLETPQGIIQNVGWVYTEPEERFMFIKDKFGFAFGMRPGVTVEKS